MSKILRADLASATSLEILLGGIREVGVSDATSLVEREIVPPVTIVFTKVVAAGRKTIDLLKIVPVSLKDHL